MAPGLGAGAGVRRGGRNGSVQGRVGNTLSGPFAFLRPSLGVTCWRGASSGAATTAGGELGVGVHRRALVRAATGRVRFPLRTRGGQERRDSGRLQQTFSSLCALQRHQREEGREGDKRREVIKRIVKMKSGQMAHAVQLHVDAHWTCGNLVLIV